MRVVETASALDLLSGWSVKGYHLRAARAMLGWPIQKLAETSRLSVSTLRRLEDITAKTSPRSCFKTVVALQAAGVRFILVDGSVIGVALFCDLDVAPSDAGEMTDRRIHRYALERSHDEAGDPRPSANRDASDCC